MKDDFDIDIIGLTKLLKESRQTWSFLEKRMPDYYKAVKQYMKERNTRKAGRGELVTHLKHTVEVISQRDFVNTYDQPIYFYKFLLKLIRECIIVKGRGLLFSDFFVEPVLYFPFVFPFGNVRIEKPTLKDSVIRYYDKTKRFQPLSKHTTFYSIHCLGKSNFVDLYQCLEQVTAQAHENEKTSFSNHLVRIGASLSPCDGMRVRGKGFWLVRMDSNKIPMEAPDWWHSLSCVRSDLMKLLEC